MEKVFSTKVFGVPLPLILVVVGFVAFKGKEHFSARAGAKAKVNWG
jgi:hypothetical protein